MTLSDYVENRGSWIAKQPIATPLGNLTIQLEPGRRRLPDSDMLQCADRFVALARATVDNIHDNIFAHYQRLASDPDWLEICGVPTNLDRVGVLTYLGDQTLVVRRDPDLDDPFVCRYSASPAWDEEHGISLYYEAGRWRSDDDDDDDGDEAPPRPYASRSPINRQLENAILHRNEAEIDRCLTSGLNLNDLGPSDVPPLWIAVSAMNAPLVERLLAMGADTSLPYPGAQMTALQLAKELYRQSGFARKMSLHPTVAAQKQLLDEIIRLLEAAGEKPKT